LDYGEVILIDVEAIILFLIKISAAGVLSSYQLFCHSTIWISQTVSVTERDRYLS
jgi:hypothetical protein